jgi:hypothetical protein
MNHGGAALMVLMIESVMRRDFSQMEEFNGNRVKI